MADINLSALPKEKTFEDALAIIPLCCKKCDLAEYRCLDAGNAIALVVTCTKSSLCVRKMKEGADADG